MAPSTPDLNAVMKLRRLRGTVWLSPGELHSLATGAPLSDLPRLLSDLLGVQPGGLRRRGPDGAAGLLSSQARSLRPHLGLPKHRSDLERDLNSNQINPALWTECAQLLLITQLLSELVDEYLASPATLLETRVVHNVHSALSFWYTDHRTGEAHLATRLLRSAGVRDAEFMTGMTVSSQALSNLLAEQRDLSPRALAWRGLLQAALLSPGRLTCLSPLLPEGHPAYQVGGELNSQERQPRRRSARHLSDFFDALVMPAPLPPRIAPLAPHANRPAMWGELAQIPLPAENDPEGGERVSILLWCLSRLGDDAMKEALQVIGPHAPTLWNPWKEMITQVRPPWREALERARHLSTHEYARPLESE